MKQPTALFTLSFSLLLLSGCRADTPQGPAELKTPVTQPGTQVNSDANSQGCDAIKDAAQAENCRFLEGVAAAKKKSRATPVLKHSPGSIQQP